MNGLAGTGKTTIAQTVSERLFADGQLGASFFCSRDFEDRSNLELIFPTLAVQLARNYANFRLAFIPLVQSDPGIARESLFNQMEKLIIGPLQRSAISTVIVIDALDECKDEDATSAILSVLGRLIPEVQGVKFFLTGRPEPRIQTGFRLPLLKEVTDIFVLHNVDPGLISNDIRLFLKHSFLKVANLSGGLDGWPTKEEINRLCERAAGLFIYAVATVKFIEKKGSNPRKQLDLLLRSPESTVREGKAKFKGDTTLDSLYTSILNEAFGNYDDPDNDPRVRSVLGTMVLAVDPLSPSTIATLLRLDAEDVFPLLSSAQSLILQDDIVSPVRPFHKSFPDFITDPNRCTNRRFYISPPDYHSQLLMDSLDLMNRTLEKDMCQLPDWVENSEVDDLDERIERYISPALQYACRSWHVHLVGGRETLSNVPEMTSTFHQFLERKFLFWLEVLSVLGTVRNAVDALQAAMDWLEVCRDSISSVFFQTAYTRAQESPTLALATDCSRFVAGHLEIISASSPHIYHSALVSIPKASMVWQHYGLYSKPLTRVLHGLPRSWTSNTAATRCRFEIRDVVWSPCDRFVAVASPGPTVVDILDSGTLQRIQSLKFSWSIDGDLRALIFSPDSRVLTCTAWKPYSRVGSYRVWEAQIVNWDVQTGGIVSTIWRNGKSFALPSSPRITYSTNGKMVAVDQIFSSTGNVIISIYDVFSGEHRRDVKFEEPLMRDIPVFSQSRLCIWAHGEFLRLSIAVKGTITTWEVNFTSGSTFTAIETLSSPDRAIQPPGAGHHLLYRQALPALRRFTVVPASGHGVLVWDAENSKSLLHCADSEFDFELAETFSSDGRFFACSTTGAGVYLWKESPTGYVLHGKLSSSTSSPTPVLSPNGESIITFAGHTIQLWNTKNISTTPFTTPTQATLQARDFVLEFIPNRSLAVFARQEDDMVTVLDLESGLTYLTIDTGMGVCGLRAIANTVVAISDEKVVAWNLPGGNLLNAGMDDRDSAWTIQFRDDDSESDLMYDTVSASLSQDLRHVAILERYIPWDLDGRLHVFNTSTLRRIGTVDIREVGALWFPPNRQRIWCVNGAGEVDVHEITDNGLSCKGNDIEGGAWGYPWESSLGYRAVGDRWVLGPDGGRLLMLPPAWQSDAVRRVWNGKFLALLHGGLPEPVILELEP